MNKIIKRIVSAVTAVAVTLTAVFVFDVPEKITAAAAGGHTHKVCVNADNCPSCSHGNVVWTAWTDSARLPSSEGNYYLTTDVTFNYGRYTDSDINLCLNGHTISGTGLIGGIVVEEGAFTLCDCSSGQTGKITINGAPGVRLYDNSNVTFTMYSGNISNCTSGCGVLVDVGSNTFTMYGGTISGNNTNDGSAGGVHVARNSSFIMYGGKILNNKTASYGGGVSVLGTFTMYGGEISGNTAQMKGGGINVGAGATLNGKVNITGNKSGTDNLVDNIFVRNGYVLSIGDNFSTESKAGITLEGDISCGDKSTLTGTLSNSQAACFTSDDTGRKVIYEDGVLKLEKPHTWNAGTETTAATCTAKGVKTYTCSVCNATKTEDIAALGHNWSTSWTTDGNNHWHTCTRSGCTSVDSKAAHSGGTATCQEKATCSVCGQKYGSLGAHNYSTAWTTSSTQHWHACQTAGCTDKSDTDDHTFVQKKDGTNHWQECSVCGYKKDETAHSWSNWTLKTEPTLNTTGTAERACDCGEKQTKTDVPALTDTIWTKSNRTDPTLDGAGSEDYTSTDYGKVIITIPALSNETVWTKTSHKDATEEAEGEDVYESTDYGTVKVILPRLDHTHVWGGWEITKAPTLNGEGTAKRVCTKDDTHIDTKTLPALTDETVWTKDESRHVDPTEEETGLDIYISVYGDVEVVLPKKEHTHTWGAWSITANPTLTTTGTAERACTKNSTHKETKELPALTDTAVWTKDESRHVDPTEEETGLDIYISVYGEVEVILPVKEHTHVWGNWTITTEPTLTATGTAQRVCTLNNTHIDTKTLPALTDTSVWTKVDDKHVDPTEENDGKDVYTSEYGEVTVILPALGHTHEWGGWTITTAPTLTETGTAQRVCTKNAEHIETKTLPVLTDTSVWTKADDKHVDPTEDSDGKDVYTSEYGEVTVILPALGHTHEWGEWTITTAPTLTETGTAQRVCTKNAEHMETKTLPVLTDTTVWTKADDKHVDPTEDSDGKDVYTSEYGEVIIVLPALGHTHEWGGEWSKDDTYHWHDCLKNCGEKKDNAAHIWDGGTVTKEPAADAEGEKTFECTVCGKTKTETLPPKDEPSEPDGGNISVNVQPEGNAPDTELKTPFNELADAVLTPEEQESIKDGVDIKIILFVSDATESVPADDNAKVEAAIRGLSDYKLGQYLDINLMKIIGDSEGVRITQTNKPITVAFGISEDLGGKAEYSVIRVHGGETEVLRDLDNDSGTVTIETDKFSTYTLVYKEKNTPSNPGGGNTSGGNSADSFNPPAAAPGDSDNSDNASSDDDNPSRDDISDTASSESKPTDEDNSEVTSSGNGNAALSGNGNAALSESDTSSNVSDHSPSESSGSVDNGNPSTGIAVSLIPLVTAVAVLTAASKRKRNK